MNNFEIKETLRQSQISIGLHESLDTLYKEVRHGDMSLEVFALQAFELASHAPIVNGLGMLRRRAQDLLNKVEDEGMRIASLKPERKEGFMEPFWVDGHWKFTPKLGHDEHGNPRG